MGLDRSKQLVAEGFELAATRAVALPFTIWKVNLEVEFDRELRLAEETVLRLIAAGVTKPDQISSLMGLSPGVIVQATIVNLLRKGLVSHIDVLAVTPLGRQAIHSQIAKGQRTYEDIHLEHDPYRNSFQWKTDEASLKSHKDVKEAGLHSLPIPIELTRLDVETHAPQNAQGRSFALHPAMGALQAMFDTDKRLAILPNVGTLILPTSKTQYGQASHPKPVSLFSHNDQQNTWQSFQPEGATVGWGGRMGDLLASMNSRAVFTSITAGGNAVWLSGNEVRQYQVTSK